MLTKPLNRVFVPAVPAVPYRPEQTVCAPVQQPGTWEWVCRRIDYNWRQGNVGVQVPPGAQHVVVTNNSGEIVDMYFLVCASVFRPDSTTPSEPECVTYPEQQAVPGSPARYEDRIELSWTSGANSVDTLDGDVAVRFDIPQAVGTIVGFSSASRDDVPDRARIRHGLYFFQTASGQRRMSVFENGRALTQSYLYSPEDRLEIRRVNGSVTYWRGTELLYQSLTPSSGELYVASSLYASGDTIG